MITCSSLELDLLLPIRAKMSLIKLSARSETPFWADNKLGAFNRFLRHLGFTMCPSLINYVDLRVKMAYVAHAVLRLGIREASDRIIL